MEKLKKILNTFYLGVTLLILAYILVYYFGNEVAYKQEILSLQNVKLLIYQCVMAGFLNVIITEAIESVMKFARKCENEKLTAKVIFKFLLVFSILFLVFAIGLENSNMSDNVASTYFFNIIIAMIITSITGIIERAIEVNKINEFLGKRDEVKKG